MNIQNSYAATDSRQNTPGLAQRLIGARLRAFRTGNIEITLPNGRVVRQEGSLPGPAATINVARWRHFWRLGAEGEVGLGRSYMDGDWSTPDLSAVFAFGLANSPALVKSASGSRLAHACNGLAHRLRANTLRGSRRNIAAHYDLGNAFYAHWLDPEMNYSSAIFQNKDESLETGQARKLDRILELLDIKGGKSVLEIGCGWGALARRLAASGSGRITGITLSSAQLEYARSAMRDAPGGEAASFQLRDYRDVEGRYDRIVSIEMLEAVGERYWPVYFQKLRSVLAPDGLAVLQVITIDGAIYDTYRRRPDFIQQHIFPGGMLPTVDILHQEAERAGFSVDSYEPFGKSYAQTLRAWNERFQKAWPQIEPLGFDERFRRMWEYYLLYCEAGFNAGQTDVGLFKLVPR